MWLIVDSHGDIHIISLSLNPDPEAFNRVLLTVSSIPSSPPVHVAPPSHLTCPASPACRAQSHPSHTAHPSQDHSHHVSLMLTMLKHTGPPTFDVSNMNNQKCITALHMGTTGAGRFPWSSACACACLIPVCAEVEYFPSPIHLLIPHADIHFKNKKQDYSEESSRTTQLLYSPLPFPLQMILRKPPRATLLLS